MMTRAVRKAVLGVNRAAGPGTGTPAPALRTVGPPWPRSGIRGLRSHGRGDV